MDLHEAARVYTGKHSHPGEFAHCHWGEIKPTLLRKTNRGIESKSMGPRVVRSYMRVLYLLNLLCIRVLYNGALQTTVTSQGYVYTALLSFNI